MLSKAQLISSIIVISNSQEIKKIPEQRPLFSFEDDIIPFIDCHWDFLVTSEVPLIYGIYFLIF